MAKTLYEGMFLFDLNQLDGDLGTAVEKVQQVLERADAEVDSLFKWDERKLAYEIKHNRRGLYLMSYFYCDGNSVAHIERDVTLSETISRCMILRADHIGDVELEEARAKQGETTDAVKLAEKEAADADAKKEKTDKKPADTAKKETVETATATKTEAKAEVKAEVKAEATAEKTPEKTAEKTTETEADATEEKPAE